MRSTQQVKDLLKAGLAAQATTILVKALKDDPNDIDAWWLLSFALAETDRQIYAVERVLQLNPGNPKAASRLAKLKTQQNEVAPVLTWKMPESAAVTATRAGRIWAISLSAAFLFTTLVAGGLTSNLRARAAQESKQSENQAPLAFVQPTQQPSETAEQVARATEQQPSPTVEQAQPSPTSESLPTAEPTADSSGVTTVSLITDNSLPLAPLPVFDQFVQSVANGEPNQRVGVFVENRFSFPIVQQPADQPGYIATIADVVTEFRIVRQKTGNEGLIAHNFLAGGQFFNLQIGDVAEIVLGDGTLIEFEIFAIEDYQALTPTSPTSDFIDLVTGKKLSASDLFYRVYGGNLTLTFQTCIARDNNSSWGRTFIIGEEL